MADGEEKARRQFSIKELAVFTAIISICLGVPKWSIIPAGGAAFITFFCLYVAYRDRAAGIFMIATCVLTVRGLVMR